MDLPLAAAVTVAVLVLWYLAVKGVPHLAEVDRVVDGDSIEIRYARGLSHVRLHGVDAPEYHGQPHGKEARKALVAILGEGRILVVPNGTDYYGRVLCRLFTRRGSVAMALAWRGHAWGETIPTKILAFLAAIMRRGLWARRGAIHPRIWRLAQNKYPRIMKGCRR